MRNCPDERSIQWAREVLLKVAESAEENDICPFCGGFPLVRGLLALIACRLEDGGHIAFLAAVAEAATIAWDKSRLDYGGLQ